MFLRYKKVKENFQENYKFLLKESEKHFGDFECLRKHRKDHSVDTESFYIDISQFPLSLFSSMEP